MGDYGDSLVLDGEVAQRVAVLRRYRELLELQRGRLQDYLELLDTREAAVKRGDFDGLEQYTQMEQRVIKGIMEAQRCVEPLAELYRAAVPEGSRDIDELRQRLEGLRQKVLARNEEGRRLLQGHMAVLRAEIDSLRLPPDTRSVYARPAAPSLVDIEG